MVLRESMWNVQLTITSEFDVSYSGILMWYDLARKFKYFLLICSDFLREIFIQVSFSSLFHQFLLLRLLYRFYRILFWLFWYSGCYTKEMGNQVLFSVVFTKFWITSRFSAIFGFLFKSFRLCFCRLSKYVQKKRVINFYFCGFY